MSLPKWGERLARSFRKVGNFSRHALRHLVNRDLAGWMARLQAQLRLSPSRNAASFSSIPSEQWRFGVMTPKRTEYVAHMIRDRLQAHGWQAEILTTVPNDFDHDWYVVISPRSFTGIPPGKKRILFPMDDPEIVRDYSKKDYDLLKGSIAVLESSQLNLEHLARKKIAFPQVYYLPVESPVSSASAVRSFAFMFDRFLVAEGFLPVSHVGQMELPIPASVHNIGLSLPETIERRRTFDKGVPPCYCVFDGIRRQPGWMGCGLSYMALALHALECGQIRLSVMEDDAMLPGDFDEKIAIVEEFLDYRWGQWDVFAGMITELHPETRILSVQVYRDITFVTISRMSSTVFNIYSETALRILAAWNPENQDAETNTIDRYIGSQDGLRVVVALPFLVGHREEVHSTLWGSSNALYAALIKSSEQALFDKVKAFRSELVSV